MININSHLMSRGTGSGVLIFSLRFGSEKFSTPSRSTCTTRLQITLTKTEAVAAHHGLYAAATGYAGLLTVYLLLVAAAASLKKANRAEKEEVAFVYSTNAVGGCVGDLRAAIYVHILVYMIIIEPSIARCLCRPDSLDPSRPFYFVYPHLVRSCIRYGHRRNHPGCLGASGSSGAEAAG